MQIFLNTLFWRWKDCKSIAGGGVCLPTRQESFSTVSVVILQWLPERARLNQGDFPQRTWNTSRALSSRTAVKYPPQAQPVSNDRMLWLS